MLKVNDLKTDFSDGVLLINLLEIISSKEIKTYNKKPKIRPQKLENNDFALQFLKREGIKLVNIGAAGETKTQTIAISSASSKSIKYLITKSHHEKKNPQILPIAR